MTIPPKLARARMYCGLLERFGGYTMTTLMDEDLELLQMVAIEAAGRPPEGDDDG